jgi:hypothetical protein
MIQKVLLYALVLLALGGSSGIVGAADKTAATPSQTAPDNTGELIASKR